MSRRVIAVITAGFFTVFTAYGIRYMYGVLLPKMLPALEINKAEAGIIYASYFIAYTIFSPILGLMADRLSIRLILTAFPAMLCLGTFLMSYSSSLLNSSLFFALAGLGSAACWSPVMALILRWVSDRRRGIALAITDMGSTSGILVWTWLMPYIVEASDWMAGWKSLAAMALIATVLNAVLIKDKPLPESIHSPSTTINVSGEKTGYIYLKLLQNKMFWLIGLSYMLVGFSVLIPFTFLTAHAVETFQMPYQTAKWLIIVIAIFGLIGKLTIGYYSDVLGRIKMMILCSLLIAAGSFGIMLSNTILTLAISCAIFGLGYGALWAVYAAVASDYFPKMYSGRIIGLWTVYLGIGSIVAPPLAGWTIDTTGSYAWAFLLTSVSAAISILLLFPLIKTRPHPGSNL